MAAAPPYEAPNVTPGYTPTPSLAPAPSYASSEHPPPYGAQPIYQAQPVVGQPVYYVGGETTPLVAPVYASQVVYADPEHIRCVAQRLRVRGIWMIVFGTMIFIASLITSIALLATMNIFYFSFVFFILGGVLIAWGIRYLRLAHFMLHHGVIA